MIEFRTGEVVFSDRTAEVPILATPLDNLQAEADVIVCDGREIELPEDLVKRAAENMQLCGQLEAQGMGVDCSVFGVLMFGGTYNPLPRDNYRNDMRWQVDFGRYTTRDEAYGSPDRETLVVFTYPYEDIIVPNHTAIQLPGHEGLYLQKVGSELPFALSGIEQACRFFRSASTTIPDRMSATYRGEKVVEYVRAGAVAGEAMATYGGIPLDSSELKGKFIRKSDYF